VKAKGVEHQTWLIRVATRWYGAMLARVMIRRSWVLGAGVVLLAGTAGLALQMGSEFVPQLDEGDVLVEARRLPGVALSESIATDARLQKAILRVPEVTQVVSKTGAPELATDPMGIEQTDVYIGLKDRKEWRPGVLKEDVAAAISQAVEAAVPEVASAISQPIQMRTNELVAGVRSDVAALIYGPDLARLGELGEALAAAIRSVEGAEDVRVEQVAGLRYLEIEPDRNKLARYGLTIADINQLAETIAVGHRVGDVLEGERRFGIVVKTDHGYQGDPAALQALPLIALSGQVVPLGDVASISYFTGPAEINREAQSRRIMVEFNVRGRDLLSVVNEVKRATGRVAMPTGYRVEWGGQFQHYEDAKARLLVVVPLALCLILFLLWMALRSLRAGLLIFLNVPFAAVGGILALWLRDTPFSVSTGVGFIALFGVAVLNGLVLVTFAAELERTGVGRAEAIERAARLRLRPVLMTALVASLGFLPMALSTAPGSEVQRPLATVVIGGLFSATLLTLLVLPAAYATFSGRKAGARAGLPFVGP
jgi:heavy metal efflux system protein